MMMNHKISGIALAVMLVFGFLLPLPAQVNSTLIPGGQATIDGRAWLTFTGPNGMRILALAPFPEDARQRLEHTVSVVSSWPTIRVTELRAESSKGVDDYVLSFPSIQHQGREYSANVPGGLRLRFDGALMFDFRVRSSDYFVRVRGVLMDEASLIAEIAKAVQDPGAYIAERDPSWLALRIEQLDRSSTQMDRRIDQLDSRTVEINRRLTQKTDENAARVMGIEDRINSRIEQVLALVETRSAETRSLVQLMATDFDTRLGQVQEQAAEDRRTFEATLSANQALFASLAGSLRLALASEMNKGLFGGPKPLDPSVLDHIIDLKAGNSAADRATALESAKAAGLKTKAKEIDIIFRVWFGE